MPLPLLLSMGLSLCGCGGSGGGSPAPAPVTVTLLSSTTLDGFVFGSGPVELINEIYVGDVNSNDSVRGFVSFDLAAIPAGATVVGATLTLYQWAVLGTPYTSLGSQVVDHVDYGPSLDAADFALAALTSGFGTLASDATIGSKSLAVTTQVVADRAALRTRSQFRLRFSLVTDGDGSEDTCTFRRAGSAIPAEAPTLIVTYQP